MIVHLCREDFDAAYNLTAKHAASITGGNVSAHLVQRVRERNGLLKAVPWKKKFGKIKSNYSHVVSVDVVREQGEHIFGFIQDRTKVVYHHHAKAQTAQEAVFGLQQYIERYGKPDAVRCDNGSEFKGVFKDFLNDEKIHPLRPLPYNPKANGFIERYFRTLRNDLFRKLTSRNIPVSQEVLNDFAFLWNHCRNVGSTGKTPGELASIVVPTKELERFQIEKKTIGNWTFWHIEGIHGFMHAYLRVELLRLEELNQGQKIA